MQKKALIKQRMQKLASYTDPHHCILSDALQLLLHHIINSGNVYPSNNSSGKHARNCCQCSTVYHQILRTSLINV